MIGSKSGRMSVERILILKLGLRGGVPVDCGKVHLLIDPRNPFPAYRGAGGRGVPTQPLLKWGNQSEESPKRS